MLRVVASYDLTPAARCPGLVSGFEEPALRASVWKRVGFDAGAVVAFADSGLATAWLRSAGFKCQPRNNHQATVALSFVPGKSVVIWRSRAHENLT